MKYFQWLHIISRAYIVKLRINARAPKYSKLFFFNCDMHVRTIQGMEHGGPVVHSIEFDGGHNSGSPAIELIPLTRRLKYAIHAHCYYDWNKMFCSNYFWYIWVSVDDNLNDGSGIKEVPAYLVFTGYLHNYKYNLQSVCL